MLPTLCLVHKGKVKDYVMGFDDLGGKDDFKREVLEWRIGVSGVINYTGPCEGPPSEKKTITRGFITGKNKETNKSNRRGYADDSDSDDDF